MDTLSFIPRAVKKRAPIHSTPKTTSTDQTSNTGFVQTTNPDQHLAGSAKPIVNQPQNKADLWELAALICLALSDYALWLDPELKRKIDLGGLSDAKNTSDEDAMQTEDDGSGYIPLTYIMEHSSIFRLSNPLYKSYPPTLYVKALRTHAPGDVDVRLVLSSGTVPTARSRGDMSTSSGTGYEVRKRMGAKSRSETVYGKLYWEQRTIYMENIPTSYRTTTGIIRLIFNLLPDKAFSRLQNITFLPHHKDKAGAIPVCKGFALLTLENIDDVEHLLKSWPWNRSPLPSTEARDTYFSEIQSVGAIRSEDQESWFKAQNDARKFGLRTLGKRSWEALKAEYLLYRQKLVEEMNQMQDENAPIHPSEKTQMSEDNTTTVERRATSFSNTSRLNFDDPYPYGCLVFIRNVHTETNKTTLRSLFNRLCAVSTESDDALGIDYVDYTKGTDNCFLRLKTPEHASYLVQQVNSSPIYQQSGLDAEGNPEPSTVPSAGNLRAEVVLGTREELYWNKIPERVRRQAVEMAITHSSTTPSAKVYEHQFEQGDSHLVVSPDAPYPTNCLVFVRNVHVGTNKTTLRTLFAHLCASSSPQSGSDTQDGIDYVDYSKGMDACHLRLCTPSQATRIVSAINSSGIQQLSGLDATGEKGEGPSIQAELITGKREELYWEKLPEKIRKQAVEKVISAARGNSVGAGAPENLASRLKRKRENKRA